MVYHVLNRGNGRLRLFHKEGDYDAFERATGWGHPLTGTREPWAAAFAPRKALHDAASPAAKMKRALARGFCKV